MWNAACIKSYLTSCFKSCVRESKHVYLFFQCFGNFHFCVEIKSSNYSDGVSLKLKYLNSYEYISNPGLFIISLERRHFGSRKA